MKTTKERFETHLEILINQAEKAISDFKKGCEESIIYATEWNLKKAVIAEKNLPEYKEAYEYLKTERYNEQDFIDWANSTIKTATHTVMRNYHRPNSTNPQANTNNLYKQEAELELIESLKNMIAK